MREPAPRERRPDLSALERMDAGHEPRHTPPAWDALSYLLAGPLMLGLPAYFLDRWLGTTWIVLPAILIGMAVSLYLVWVRYGRG